MCEQGEQAMGAVIIATNSLLIAFFVLVVIQSSLGDNTDGDEKVEPTGRLSKATRSLRKLLSGQKVSTIAIRPQN
jgi:hypothetical protein